MNSDAAVEYGNVSGPRIVLVGEGVLASGVVAGV